MDVKSIDGYLAKYGFTINDLEIDENHLDMELVKQPALFHHFSREQTNARSNYDKAVSTMKSETASLALKIRNGEIDLGKVTETAITQYLECAKELDEFRKEVAETKYELDEWTNIVETVKQKSFSMTQLCGLFSAGYWTVK